MDKLLPGFRTHRVEDEKRVEFILDDVRYKLLTKCLLFTTHSRRNELGAAQPVPIIDRRVETEITQQMDYNAPVTIRMIGPSV